MRKVYREILSATSARGHLSNLKISDSKVERQKQLKRHLHHEFESSHNCVFSLIVENNHEGLSELSRPTYKSAFIGEENRRPLY